ncbi:unnamed protein product, partial [Mesorhabditis spiculigera]
MLRSAFLGAALAMLALGQSSKCPANAVYAYNIGCDSCDFRAPANGQMTGGCATAPRFSCICSEGYARVKSNGPCIPLAQCPGNTKNQGKCPANEEYIKNVGCDSCENRFLVDGKPLGGPCATAPKTSCVCVKGYGRNDAGKCVVVSKCPQATTTSSSNQTCVPNATYKMNGDCDSCEARTQNLPCMAKPMMSCVCDAGYAKASSSGPCVPVSQCPRRTRKLFAAGCAMEEEFKLNAGCDSCANRQPGAKNTACATAPQYSCVCASGYGRNPAGKCVKLAQCPKAANQCDANATYKQNVGCDSCLARTQLLPCATAPQTSCVCDSGYARVSQGTPCIPVSQCPKLAKKSG